MTIVSPATQLASIPRRPKLLALNFFPSFHPAKSGGEQRSFHVLDALSRQYHVVSMTPTYAGTRDEIVRFSPTFEEWRFSKTAAYQQWHAEFKRQNIAAGGADIAMALAVQRHRSFMATLHQHWPDSDVIVIQHPCALPAISGLDRTGKRIVYLSHNCEFDLAAQRLDEGPGHDYLSLIGQLEYRLCRIADHIAVASPDDQTKLMALCGVAPNAFVSLPNGSQSRFSDDTDLRAALGKTAASSVVFMGSNWPPNVAAARFIVETLAPRLRDIAFHVVGGVCRALDGVHTPSNVRLHYELEDGNLADLLKTCHIGLNPMAAGGGSNVKIADYLAHGLRIVTTPLGLRGFPSTLDNIHVASLEDMAATLAHVAGATPSADERHAWRQSTQHLWHWPSLSRTLLDALKKPAPWKLDGSSRRLVVLNEFPVRGSDNGGEARIRGLYSAACPDERIVILSFGRSHFQINTLSDQIVSIELPATAHQIAEATNANRATYSSINDFTYPMTVADNPLWLDTAERILADADGIVFSHPFMLPVYEHLVSRRRSVHDSHNVESKLKRDALETHPKRETLIPEIARQEGWMTDNAALIAACSESDAAHFRQHGARNVIVAENGVDISACEPPTIADMLAGEHRWGMPQFFDRNLYLIEEFDALAGPAFADAAYRAILKRAPDPVELAAALSSAQEVSARARLLSRLIASDHNIRRVYVVGARRRAGLDETIAVFLGSGHRPNLTAAEFLISVVAPQAPEIQFLIIGQVGLSMDLQSFGANAFAAGFVSAAMKSYLLRQAKVGLNPMIGGGGSNLKVPDYLAHGLPVVTSDFGQRGFALGPQDGVFTVALHGFAAETKAVVQRFRDKAFDPRPALEIILGRYAWPKISERFLSNVRRALGTHNGGDIIVICEEASCLRFAPLSHAAQLVSYLADQGRVRELIVQSQKLAPSLARELKSSLPVTLETVTLAIRDREHALHNMGQLRHDNVGWSELDVVHATAPDEDILAACDRVEISAPVILSGAGHAVASEHPWRFVSDELIVALPDQTQELLIRGVAHFATEITINALAGHESRSFRVHGKFEVRCEIPATVIKLTTRLIDPIADTGGAVHVQLNRLAAITETVDIEADLWINSASALHQLGLPSGRSTLISGHPDPLISQELEILIERRAPTTSTILAIGSAAFSTAIDNLVRRHNSSARVVTCDGALLSSADQAQVPQPIAGPFTGAEIGIAHNSKEQRYLAGMYVKPDTIVLLAEHLNGEILQFATELKKAISARFATCDVALLVASGVRAADPSADVRRMIDGLTIITPESAKALLSILGSARLVIVRQDACHFARTPALLDMLAVPGVVWLSGEANTADVFRDLPTVASVGEVVEHLWRPKPKRARTWAPGDMPSETIDAILGHPIETDIRLPAAQ